jgi:ankyrin repeat protein
MIVLECRDMNGNTPLHLAAASGYSQTMTAILNIHGHLLDVPNKRLVSCSFYESQLNPYFFNL